MKNKCVILSQVKQAHMRHLKSIKMLATVAHFLSTPIVLYIFWHGNEALVYPVFLADFFILPIIYMPLFLCIKYTFYRRTVSKSELRGIYIKGKECNISECINYPLIAAHYWHVVIYTMISSH